MRTAALVALTGCGIGVGPYQPRRDKYATAGGASPTLGFDDAGRRAAHQEARKKTLPEVLGGDETSMYAFDGGYYVGVKQGANQTRSSSDAWSGTVYAFEIHTGFFQTLFSDHLTLGANLFAVGYGTGNDTTKATNRYIPGGVELAAKVGLADALAMRASAGVLYGNAEYNEGAGGMKDTAPAWGKRATAGLDLVMFRFHGNDVVLTTEAQLARTDEVTLLARPRHIEARALLFELVLVGI